MARKTRLWLLGLLMTSGCELFGARLECGPDTIERDGKCVSSSAVFPPISCGPGTYFDPAMGRCMSAWYDGGLPCDPNSTVVEFNDAGQPWCVGTGGDVDCATATPPPCPAPSPSHFSVCGRVHDMGTSQAIDEVRASTLVVSVYDSMQILSDPANAPSLLDVYPTKCGFYTASDIPVPGMGLATVTVDDREGLPDVVVKAALNMTVSTGLVARNRRAYAFSHELDAQWTSSAGDPFAGMTFAQKGVYVSIFIDQSQPAVAPYLGTPKAGVTVTMNTEVQPANDFYFGDTDPISRTTVASAQNATGTNGTSLYVNGAMGTYSGVGAEPGCAWPAGTSLTVAGYAIFDEYNAGGPACP